MHMRPGGAASTPTMALRYDPRDPRDPANMPMLSKERLRVLVAQIDPAFRLENDVEEMMLEIADDFLTSVTEKACRLARHRDSVRVGVRDARIPLEQDWNIRVPGFGAEPAPHDKDDSDAPGASTTAATGADGKDDAAATATDNAADPDSKSRLHTQRVQKVREAIRDAGKHRHSGASSALGTTLPGTAAGISMNNTSAAGPAAGAQSASAAAGQPGAVAGGVRKSTASKPKPGTAAAKTKGRGAAG
ncbi:transcription initiation factor TFIID subunit A-domain-containing protein [Powellomyces hirtus]|nr:transcription initiation factor TFIID subunit A-domain-containing protein [Powellomyces hirtus]